MQILKMTSKILYKDVTLSSIAPSSPFDRMGVELLEGLSQDMIVCRICDRLTATSVLRATWPAESHACRRDMAVCPSGECSYGPCEVCGDPVMSLNLPWDLHRARVCMYCRGR